MNLLRSFGVVLWELLTHEIPYRDVDSSAIIWGVGSNCLHLPIPSSTPDGIKLLMTQCWLVTHSYSHHRFTFHCQDDYLCHCHHGCCHWDHVTAKH